MTPDINPKPSKPSDPKQDDFPTSSEKGDAWIVGDSPTGAFAGKTSGDIAVDVGGVGSVDGVVFKKPEIGDVVGGQIWNGTSWAPTQMAFAAAPTDLASLLLFAQALQSWLVSTGQMKSS